MGVLYNLNRPVNSLDNRYLQIVVPNKLQAEKPCIFHIAKNYESGSSPSHLPDQLSVFGTSIVVIHAMRLYNEDYGPTSIYLYIQSECRPADGPYINIMRSLIY